ncbi:MAG: hypothetical protein R3A48_06540 [Polyangiales bacterium]
MRTRTRFGRTLAAICVAAALTRAPALVAPPLLDDHVQAAMLEGRYPAPRSPFDLYAFARGDGRDRARLRAEGTLPWWTADDYQLVMLRPLSSALVAFDHLVLRHWVLARLHSLAWACALLWAAASLMRKRAGDRAALVGAALLAADDALTSPVVWHANRCALVAVTLALVAVDAACDALDRRSGRRGALAVAAALGACLAGEYAWTVLPAIALYAKARHPERASRVFAALGALAVAYALARSARGEGCAAACSAPTSEEPRAAALSPSWVVERDAGRPPRGGRRRAAPRVARRSPRAPRRPRSARCCWRSRGERRREARPTMRWALASSVAPIAVVSTAWLSARLMLGAAVWSALLIATLATAGVKGRVARLAMIALLTLHGPVKAVATWRAASDHLRGTRRSWRGAETLLAGVPPEASLYVLNATDPEEVYFGRYTMRARGVSTPRRWFVLASTPAAVHVFRESPRVLSIVHPRSVLDGVSARFFRSGVPWPATGARARVGDATVTVLDGDRAGVRRLRVEFAEDLNDPSIAIVESTASGLRRVTLPAVGGSIQLRAPRDVMLETVRPSRRPDAAGRSASHDQPFTFPATRE